MNDGNDDEFSATRGGGGGGEGEDAQRGNVCAVCTYMCIYALCVSE